MENMNRFEYFCFFQTRHSLDDVFIRDRLYRNRVRAAPTGLSIVIVNTLAARFHTCRKTQSPTSTHPR